MLHFVFHALATCASIAGLVLLAPTAAAELPIHPLLQAVGPDVSDVGPDPETAEEPQFGSAVVIRDELAFVGMPRLFAGGSVAVFRATPTALFRTGTLTASDAVQGARFGRLLVYRDGILVVADNSAAYVFQRSNGVWKQRQKLTAPAADNASSFADALRYEDGTLAIGADMAASGVVYIYQRDATGKFIPRGKLVSTDSSPGDGFGAAISTAGSVMVVGAPGIGTAYVFRRNSAGVWRQHQTLFANELGPRNRTGFGGAVAIDRQMIIIGAAGVGFSADSSYGAGAAYGFTPGGGVYVETFKLKPGPDDVDHYRLFGYMVAMFDGRIVIAAQHRFSSDTNLNGILAFTYTRAGSSVLARGVAEGDFSSTSMSLANQRLLLGMPCTSTFTGCAGSGKANLYNLNVFE